MVANLDRIVPPPPAPATPQDGRPWFLRNYVTSARMSLVSHFCMQVNGQYAEAGSWVIEDENVSILQSDSAFRENFESLEGSEFPALGEMPAQADGRLSTPLDVMMTPIVVQPLTVTPFDDRHETYVGIFATADGGRIELSLDKFGIFFSRAWYDPSSGQCQSICKQTEPLSIQARELIDELDQLCGYESVMRFKLDGLDHQRAWAEEWDDIVKLKVEQVVLHLRDLVSHARAYLSECAEQAAQQVSDMTYVMFDRTNCVELLQGLPYHSARDPSVSSSTIRALGLIQSMGPGTWSPGRVSPTAPDPSSIPDRPRHPGSGLEPA